MHNGVLCLSAHPAKSYSRDMSKKVLILSASPRPAGNSDLLCDQFLAGATAAHHQAEKVFLAEKKINYCTGCYTCGGNGKCVQKDDMEQVLEKMLSADVIVMATPVYFYTMCAQMKTLIDRTLARYMALSNKEFYFLLTAGTSKKASLERTVEGFRGFMSCLKGAKEKGIVYGAGAFEIGDIKKSPAMEQAYAMGKGV